MELGGDDPGLYLELIAEVFRLHSSKKCTLPSESYLRFGDVKSESTKGRHIGMPAYIDGGLDIVGLKWISSRPQNQDLFNLPRAIGLIVLNDIVTGMPCCIMEAGLIKRCNADSGCHNSGGRKPTRKGSKVLSIIGTGRISNMHVKFFNFKKYEFEEVKIFDKSNLNMLKFKKDVEELYGFHARVKENAKNAIDNSDIILVATTTTVPYVKKNWIAKGSLFC